MESSRKNMVLALAIGAALVLARGCESEAAVVERVAEAEHEQWTAWSKSVAEEVSPERRARWEKYWIPYKDLPDDIKELDREWARKALAAARRK